MGSFNPNVTVLMPVYNGETYLEDVINTSKNEKIRTAAIGSLGNIISPVSVEALKRLRLKESGMLMKKIIERSIEKIERTKFEKLFVEERKKRDERMKEWDKKKS